jgi:hypothetical protein
MPAVSDPEPEIVRLNTCQNKLRFNLVIPWDIRDLPHTCK